MGMRVSNTSFDDFHEASEINVTPFIDVILVLMIIFMVAAPISTVNVPIDLPVSSAPQQPAPEKPLVISLKNDSSLFIGDEPVTTTEIAKRLASEGATTDTRLFLRGDKHVAYGDLMALLDLLRDSGYRRVSLVGAQAE